MFEQSADERFARIIVRILLRWIGARQEHARLDVNQRRRHDEELAGNVEIQLLHQVDVFQILLRDQRDRNVVDVDLVPLDQVQQQIERALEDRQPYGIGFENRLELGSFHHAYFNLTAPRTRSIVSLAMPLALREPSWRISRSRSGFDTISARRARIGSR
jgi:hypothetical protein